MTVKHSLSLHKNQGIFVHSDCQRYAAVSTRPGCRGFATDVCVPISRLAEMVTFAQDEIRRLGLFGTFLLKLNPLIAPRYFFVASVCRLLGAT